MNQKLHHLMTRSRDEVVAVLVTRLSVGASSTADATVRSHAEKLMDTLASATDGCPDAFLTAVESWAKEHLHQRRELSQLQYALGAAEQELWRAIIADVASAHQVKFLSFVSYLFGAARDRLARVYVAGQYQVVPASPLPKANLEALFKGTDAAPIDGV